MPLTVANNVASLNSQHNLGRSSSALNRSLERLSSGLKINRAADGPAALVISEKQRAQIAGLNQAIENSEKAVSMVQTAEGALNEINSLLVKVRSLAIDSANTGVNDAEALAANQSELDNALDTINRIANNTQFGTKKLLDGSLSSGKVLDAGITSFTQTGLAAGNYGVTLGATNAKYTISTDVSDGEASGLTNAADSDGMGAASTFNNNATATILDSTGGVLATINITAGDTVGAAVAALQTAADSANVGVDVTFTDAASASFSLDAQDFGSYADGYDLQITDGTTTYTTSAGTNAVVATMSGTLVTNAGAMTQLGNRGNTFQNAAGTVTVSLTDTAMAGITSVNAVEAQEGAVFQIGANKDQTASVNVSSTKTADLGRVGADTLASLLTGGSLTMVGGQAQGALAVIDQAIDDVTSLRADLGAFQANTLESTANNLRATLENTVNAESVIRDTDFAMEIAEMTKQQVLVQAGTSVLSTANQNPQLVLSLLQ